MSFNQPEQVGGTGYATFATLGISIAAYHTLCNQRGSPATVEVAIPFSAVEFITLLNRRLDPGAAGFVHYDATIPAMCYLCVGKEDRDDYHLFLVIAEAHLKPTDPFSASILQGRPILEERTPPEGSKVLGQASSSTSPAAALPQPDVGHKANWSFVEFRRLLEDVPRAGQPKMKSIGGKQYRVSKGRMVEVLESIDWPDFVIFTPRGNEAPRPGTTFPIRKSAFYPSTEVVKNQDLGPDLPSMPGHNITLSDLTKNDEQEKKRKTPERRKIDPAHDDDGAPSRKRTRRRLEGRSGGHHDLPTLVEVVQARQEVEQLQRELGVPSGRPRRRPLSELQPGATPGERSTQGANESSSLESNVAPKLSDGSTARQAPSGTNTVGDSRHTRQRPGSVHADTTSQRAQLPVTREADSVQSERTDRNSTSRVQASGGNSPQEPDDTSIVPTQLRGLPYSIVRHYQNAVREHGHPPPPINREEPPPQRWLVDPLLCDPWTVERAIDSAHPATPEAARRLDAYRSTYALDHSALGPRVRTQLRTSLELDLPSSREENEDICLECGAFVDQHDVRCTQRA